MQPGPAAKAWLDPDASGSAGQSVLAITSVLVVKASTGAIATGPSLLFLWGERPRVLGAVAYHYSLSLRSNNSMT